MIRVTWRGRCGAECIMRDPSDRDEVTDEEEGVRDEIVAHPTRDDWHEQRERGQTREAVFYARSAILTKLTVRRSRSRT
jgi:hypothetical protein